MIAYPGSTMMQPPVIPYVPQTVQQAWENHFGAITSRDIEKLMLDYDDNSMVRAFDNGTGKKTDYRGLAQIREFFSRLLGELQDMSSLVNPVTDVEEEDIRQVFSVWRCPTSGFAQ